MKNDTGESIRNDKQVTMDITLSFSTASNSIFFPTACSLRCYNTQNRTEFKLGQPRNNAKNRPLSDFIWFVY